MTKEDFYTQYAPYYSFSAFFWQLWDLFCKLSMVLIEIGLIVYALAIGSWLATTIALPFMAVSVALSVFLILEVLLDDDGLDFANLSIGIAFFVLAVVPGITLGFLIPIGVMCVSGYLLAHNQLPQLYHSAAQFFTRLWNTLIGCHLYEEPRNLPELVDAVMDRLKYMGDTDEEAKAKYSTLQAIATQPPIGVSTDYAFSALTKMHQISRPKQSRSYVTLSFMEAAALRRTGGREFTIPSDPKSYQKQTGFFARRTTTEALLEDYAERVKKPTGVTQDPVLVQR